MGILDSTQAYSRMRVPDIMRPSGILIHLIRAIRRNFEIDGERYYQAALQDVRRQRNLSVFANTASLINGTISGKLVGEKLSRAYYGLWY